MRMRGWTLQRTALVPMVAFAVMSLSGAICSNRYGHYEQSVASTRGRIGIAIDTSSFTNPCPASDGDDSFFSLDDEDVELCLPRFTFSAPVARLLITSDDGRALSADCHDETSCMTTFSCRHCASGISDAGVDDTLDLPSVHCDIEAAFLTYNDEKRCNNRFEITVESANGTSGSMIFWNHFEYDDEDFGFGLF